MRPKKVAGVNVKRQVITGFVLLTLSTLAYYVPVYVAGLKGFDVSQVPERFYNYYCWTTSGNLLLVAIYSFYLFFMTDSKERYGVKIIFLWMIIAESFTFGLHVFNKFFALNMYDGAQIIQVCVFFIACFLWFLSRVLHDDKSDPFFPGRSYIVRFKPANIFGVFNHIANLHGHAGVYQDRKIYKFKKKTGKVRDTPISPENMESMIRKDQISIKEISRNERIKELLGKKYRLFKFNCNHLIKYAERGKW